MGWIAAAGLGLQALGAIGSIASDRQAANDNAQYRALQTQSTLTNYIQQLNIIQVKIKFLYKICKTMLYYFEKECKSL